MSVLREGSDRLRQGGVPEARLVMEHLTSHVIRCKRLDLYRRPDGEITSEELQELERGCRRLTAGEPLQYVVGEAEFWGRVFQADRRALIPRPETEVLTAAVADCRELWRRSSPRVFDAGTGGGCMVITLALERPAGRYWASDMSADALALARANAARHGVTGRVRWVAGDWLDAVRPESLDAVVSNPPYLTAAEMDGLPRHIRDHEPRLALDGGTDGLCAIRRLIPESRRSLKPGGFLFLEIGSRQAGAVTGLLREGGFCEVSVRRDWAGFDRVVMAVKPA
jgi:release factor glutamine methyltransferase